ncbi:HEAT repeat domain-containing protein [Hymenobacter sp. BT664]|uniref:HEAT repeat domain-containing protein n=1 Tax=Hymenobacter montanus TaxID=2771359 RepID=A0A927GJY4_9BACT|nr:HEAT repeat domain-containing protein [Hymenobacter montanus]MBD2768910.1 HEAT repeat domain-containing protein [Hymenobacter montanus]
MSHYSYILRSEPTELTFFDTLRVAFDLIKDEYGLEFKYAFFEEGANDLGRHVYWETGKQAILSLVEDLATPVRYLMIEAATRAEMERLGGCLKDLLPVISLEELQEEARQKMMDDPQTLVRMAIGTGKLFDPTSLEILRSGLQCDDDMVRFRAAAATSFTEWTDFLPDLIQMSQNDPSPEVRKMASLAVEACQRSL